MDLTYEQPTSSKGRNFAAPVKPKGAALPALRPCMSDGVVRVPQGGVQDYAAAERFRMLGTSIERANDQNDPFQVLLVTSATPGDGKSFTSVNLAQALAENPNNRVLLLECDFRRPAVHRYFEQENSQALMSLGQLEELPVPVRVIEENLHTVTLGSQTVGASFMEQNLAEILEVARDYYHYIVLDSSPVMLCNETAMLATMADTTLFVVRAWETRKHLVQEAIEMIGKDRILGLVMNDASDSVSWSYYKQYYAEPPRRALN